MRTNFLLAATLASARGAGYSEQGLALRLANAPCISSVCQSGARCLPSWNLTLRGRKKSRKSADAPDDFFGNRKRKAFPPPSVTS